MTFVALIALTGPVDLARHKQHAQAIWKRHLAGVVQFVNAARDTPQLKAAAQTGRFRNTVFSLRLLQTLDRLSRNSSRRNPLVIMSLYRENSRAHRSGVAVDIAAFGATAIDSRRMGRGLPAILSIVKMLGPGDYSLGLPKPPNSDPVPFHPPRPQIADWPYFPAPVPKLMTYEGRIVVAPNVQRGRLIASRGGNLAPEILRWANERGAPLEDIGSPELRIALTAAMKRGIRLRSLFPDALDHLHLEAR
jgi:hypothetical protein